MFAKSLIAVAVLIAVSSTAHAEYAGPARPTPIAQGMVEQDRAAQPNPTAEALKTKMSTIVKQMSAPGLDQLAREHLRVQYQAAVKDYRAALSR